MLMPSLPSLSLAQITSVCFAMALGLSQASRAESLKAPDFEVTMPEAGVVTARAPKGHHLNVKAPMFLQILPLRMRVNPSDAKPDRVTFPKLPRLAEGPAGQFSLSLFVCDDQNTFCEQHRVTVSFADGKITGTHSASALPPGEVGASSDKSAASASAAGDMSTRGVPAPAPAPKNALADPGRTDSHGFILNDPHAALTLAKKEKKALLIDFYGIWCPPCNELDAQVFASPEFAAASANFIKLKLDVDAEPSWELKSKYKIGGYPTVVFADANGDEIKRVVGTRAKDVFVKEVSNAWAARTKATAFLRAQADQGDADSAGKLGATYLERKEYTEAIKYLKLDVANPASRERLKAAEIGRLEDAKDQPKLMAALENAISSYPKGPLSVEYRLKLAGLYQDQREGAASPAAPASPVTAKPIAPADPREKMLLTGAIETAQALIEQPAPLESTEYTPADLWEMIADAQERLGDEKLARKAWAQAAAEYRKHQPAANERGYNLELAYALASSGDVAAAEEIYHKLEESYPEEFTFYYAHASVELKAKKLPEANRLASQALQYSYGDNRLRSALLLAKVLKEQGKPKEAASVIDSTLAKTVLPKDETIRTHRYVKSLKEFRGQLG